MYDFLFFAAHQVNNLIGKVFEKEGPMLNNIFKSIVLVKKFIQSKKRTIFITAIGIFITCNCYGLINSNKPVAGNVGNSNHPHLILHFDMNKTLIAIDTAGKKKPEEAILEGIASKVKAIWDKKIIEPISYYDYVKDHLIPNEGRDKKIKLKQNKQIAEVLNVLKEKGYLQQSHSYDSAKKIYDKAIKILNNQMQVDKKLVFKSLYNALDNLENKKIPYTLVIRTFGSDAPIIVKELNKHYGEDFIKESNFYKLEKGVLKGTDIDLYELVSKKSGNLVVQDHFDWWFNNNESWEYGKLFPFESDNNKFISLFFDDNAGYDPNNPDKNIVHPYDAISKKSVHPSKVIESNRLHPVDVIDALCNKNYFKDLINSAVKNITES
jgi:hypothetical protein